VSGFRVVAGARFEHVAEEAIATLPEPILAALHDAELVIEEIPPELPAGMTEIALADFEPGDPGPARVTLYRRPIEARSAGRAELTELVRLAVGREVAATLGLDVDLDDDWD
jgi:predicted Zn-dependent protease with MMP-like domain